MRNWKHKIRRTATEWLSLPPDALMDVSRLTCIDGSEVVVENIQSLKRVSETYVEIELDKSYLVLEGENFIVTLVTEKEVHVRGKVGQMNYILKKGAPR